MAMDKKIITDLGDELYNALKNRQVVDPLSSRYPDMTVEDAYAVQERMIARRIEAGERIVGKKIGVTGTPAIFFTDGSRITGSVPLAQIEKKLK